MDGKIGRMRRWPSNLVGSWLAGWCSDQLLDWPVGQQAGGLVGWFIEDPRGVHVHIVTEAFPPSTFSPSLTASF